MTETPLCLHIRPTINLLRFEGGEKESPAAVMVSPRFGSKPSRHRRGNLQADLPAHHVQDDQRNSISSIPARSRETLYLNNKKMDTLNFDDIISNAVHTAVHTARRKTVLETGDQGRAQHWSKQAPRGDNLVATEVEFQEEEVDRSKQGPQEDNLVASKVEFQEEKVDRSRRAIPTTSNITSSTQYINEENKEKLGGEAQPREINIKEGGVHEDDGEADEHEAAEEEIRGYLIQPPGRGSLWR